jgi:hypothetical protein
MSYTGGGHRASAEAIKDAFRIEFGDEYRVRALSLAWLFIHHRSSWWAGICSSSGWH